MVTPMPDAGPALARAPTPTVDDRRSLATTLRGTPTVLWPFVCEHCEEKAPFRTPVSSSRVGRFALRCTLDSCSGLRVFEFLGDEISDEYESERRDFAADLAVRGRALREVSNLANAATDLYLLGRLAHNSDEQDAAFRGAAIHLRVAADYLLEVYVLRYGIRKRRSSTMGKAIEAIEKRGEGRDRIKRGRVKKFLVAARYIKHLGDTAAHVALRRQSEEIEPVKSKVFEGIEMLEQLVDCTVLRRRSAA